MLYYARMSKGGLTGLDTQTVNPVGGSGTAGSSNRLRGFSTVNALGSISDGTSDLYSGAAITELYFDENGGAGQQYLKITGTLPNSGWTTMTIDTTAYARSAATFTQAGGATQWQWSAPGAFTSVQPFAGIGGSTTVVWT